MVRISEHPSSGKGRFVKLEGRVAGPGVVEVQKYCNGILSQGLELTIDASAVSFLDRDGVTLFTELMHEGVRVLNCSPFINELVKAAAV